MRAALAAEPLTRAQREERDIEALSVDELKQRIVATARRRRERRAQLQVAEAYVYWLDGPIILRTVYVRSG